jgi:sugar lactone lactonase YvrE
MAPRLHEDRSVRGLIVCLACACSGSVAPQPQAVTRAPDKPERRTLDLPGDANGVAWDGDALLVTDNTHHQVIRWRDGAGFVPFGAEAGGKHALGGIVRVGDDVVATSFGFGTDGTVLVLGASARAVPGLDPVRRRIGLARADDGTLYDVYFVAGNGKQHVGGLARIDLTTGETDLVTDLAKPVGIAVTSDTIFVSEQDDNTILALQRDTLARRVVAHLPSVDLLTLLPDGDLLTGGKSGTVSRVRPATGAVTTVATGFTQVRGIAYDPTGKRLFVVEHSVAPSSHHIYVLPFDAGHT